VCANQKIQKAMQRFGDAFHTSIGEDSSCHQQVYNNIVKLQNLN